MTRVSSLIDIILKIFVYFPNSQLNLDMGTLISPTANVDYEELGRSGLYYWTYLMHHSLFSNYDWWINYRLRDVTKSFSIVSSLYLVMNTFIQWMLIRNITATCACLSDMLIHNNTLHNKHSFSIVSILCNDCASR